jgi:hypothetical protein
VLLQRQTYSDLLSYKAGDPAVDRVTITGPYDTKGVGETPSRSRILVCSPAGSKGTDNDNQLMSSTIGDNNDEESCIRNILSTLARRAYRRPVTGEDLQTLLSFYRIGRSQGGFEAGVRTALQGILVSPDFLYRIESDPSNVEPGAAYRISDLALASRMSFFLWSSIPDDQLLDLAARGELKNAAVLEQQVRRMLGDSRSKALVSNFAGQWLSLRKLWRASPDPGLFPGFDENLRDALRKETELFFESIVREDRSVLDFLNADYTFLNERLARHYGISNVYGSEFRRVTLKDQNRRGLLGQGSILTATSYPNRTAPTLRGKWVLERILGTPPPQPPANVPALKEEGADIQGLTMRQRMGQHRANPACAGCHARMDPLGFALENFDAIGQWRMAEGSAPIDAAGSLPDGARFEGPDELRKLLASRGEQFITTIAERLLTYGVGREVEHYDQPAIRKILREAAQDDYRWSSVILGIVKSTPFQMRRSDES